MTAHKLNKIRKSVKALQPLIHCITNPISINQCANAVLALGCRPIMAEHPDEVCSVTADAQALLLNLGNISDTRIQSIILSGKTATEMSIPFVIDLVGIACSPLRRSIAGKLMSTTRPAVIKGNYSEINALYDENYKSAGVDAGSSLDVRYMSTVSAALASRYGTTVMASGKTDIITDGKKLVYINNGTEMLSKITGTGCMLGAMCSCYLSVCCGMTAATAACALLGICGELAPADKGTGSFMINLMDALSVLSDSDVENKLNLEVFDIESI